MKNHPSKSLNLRRVLTVVMDGVGESQNRFGNAVKFAHTPVLTELQKLPSFAAIAAHGKAVGLASDSDLGNSEVGHNALGAGRIFDQGAKLVQNAIDSGLLFQGPVWKSLLQNVLVTPKNSTLHFIGLLSDGNVHSHERHLYALMKKAAQSGVKRIRVHVLLDGRDVGEKSAEVYVDRLNQCLSELVQSGVDAAVSSGGGRMVVTMDRYDSDWDIVKRGWEAHVHGFAAHKFSSLSRAIESFRLDPKLSDQYLPPFVIENTEGKTDSMKDGDGVVFFNFRGDRAIQISKAFCDEMFPFFDRGFRPKVFYCGMMQYDGDLHIPEHFLVQPPLIDHTLGEYLASLHIRQFACSETQKYGHVSYFWNGNRSGKFSDTFEEYLEIPSDRITFEKKPWMKAHEITEAAIERMKSNSFDFARINYANGDMVGHTGDFNAAVVAMSTVDLMLGRLVQAARETDTILIITADHGNCDEMFDAKEKDHPDWEAHLGQSHTIRPKTSHTLSPVPFVVFDPANPTKWVLKKLGQPFGLANVANTALILLGLEPQDQYLPSMIESNRS